MKRTAMALFTTMMVIGCVGSKPEKSVAPEKMELGWIHRADFVKPDYPKFKENYDTVQIQNNFVEMIRTLSNSVDIVVVLGTWCGDSKREVPRFLKIVDLSEIPSTQVTFYGVDRTKKSADGVTEKHHIERVPTFLFLKHGEEVGRIVESPKNSLEEDMLVILADAQSK